MARRRRERRIFFPWERSGLRKLPWARSRPVFVALATIALLSYLGKRERDRTGVRSTHATLVVVREAIDAFRADRDGRCPSSLTELQDEGYLRIAPVDAWGRPLQLTCPGRRNTDGYDLVSFGPTGDMNGLGRVQ